ncbi:hypothetical protein GCM10011506_44700 [Marivirga lumbricoides]|uniref:DUF1735 domain-containing protein n=1 Tax=Marivirga lumbricoides TaxID=1046115 RepID=A0ABQ1N4X9_9BACT|nr:hypothetical protein GCM10011506_44700 [Marivirga lumbricoides]
MKILLALIITSMILFYSCKNGEESLLIAKKGEVSFSFALNESNENGRVISSIPTGSIIQLSIKTLEGTEVLSRKQVSILSLNGVYASEPFELVEGSYVLTEFLILNSEGEVLYATPVSGSPKEELVSISLPYSFSVAPDHVSQVSMEVLDVSTLTPEDIGYTSLNFKITHHFFLSVFKIDENTQTFAEADAYIIQNQDTLKELSIEAKINALSFSGNDTSVFTLVIIKDGFAKYSEEWTIKEIRDQSDNAIVSVTLIPALTFVALPNGYNTPDESNFSFALRYPDNIIIDWGDGVIDSLSGTDIDGHLEHTYEKTKRHFVSVTGDIDRVEEFYSYYGQGKLAEINLKNLPSLKDFRYGYNGHEGTFPLIMDFTHNTQLRLLDLAGNYNLDKIIISETNSLLNISLFSLENISTQDLDQFVDALYSSVVANNRREGYISIAIEDGDEIVVTGPPSQTALAKFRIMRDQYDWYFDSPFDEELDKINLQAYVEQ